MAAMKVTISAAMRARDVSRPRPEDLAEAEATWAGEADGSWADGPRASGPRASGPRADGLGAAGDSGAAGETYGADGAWRKKGRRI
ncbi:MAG: hypothetical protein ACRDPD_27285 [Streptosporangiaceae bacterium]